MKIITTAECIEWLDLSLKVYTTDWPTLDAERGKTAKDALSAMRAKLLAAEEVAKAASEYEEWRDGHTTICGYDSLPQDFAHRDRIRKALTNYRNAGGQ